MYFIKVLGNVGSHIFGDIQDITINILVFWEQNFSSLRVELSQKILPLISEEKLRRKSVCLLSFQRQFEETLQI